MIRKMKEFGILKSKVIKKLSDSYSNGTLKEDIKICFNPIMENKTIKDLYVFYEEIENKTFPNVEIATEYINEVATTLKGKHKKINKFLSDLDKKIGDVSDVEFNQIYEYLDILLYDDKLTNISEKLNSKTKLIEHLLRTKKTETNLVENYSINERLLHAVMVNSFNDKFTNNLSEEEKLELKEILNLNEDDLNMRIKELKETVLTNINNLLFESSDEVLKVKLNDVINEVNSMSNTKFNYYKLNKLRSDIL